MCHVHLAHISLRVFTTCVASSQCRPHTEAKESALQYLNAYPKDMIWWFVSVY